MLKTNIALVHLCSAFKTIHLCSNSACSIGILLCTNLNMCLCICGTWNHLSPISYLFSSLKYSWYFSSKNPKIPNQAFIEKKIIQTWNTSHYFLIFFLLFTSAVTVLSMIRLSKKNSCIVNFSDFLGPRAFKHFPSS